MSTSHSSHDSLRIPPKPLLVRAEPAPNLPMQVALSAVAGFGLAWILSLLNMV